MRKLKRLLYRVFKKKTRKPVHIVNLVYNITNIDD